LNSVSQCPLPSQFLNDTATTTPPPNLYNQAGRLAAGLTALLKQKRDIGIPNLNQLAALVKSAEEAKT